MSVEKQKRVENPEQSRRVGKFLGIPYDFRKPTWTVVKERMWNRDDKRIFTPKVFGWGWTINFFQVFRKLRLVK